MSSKSFYHLEPQKSGCAEEVASLIANSVYEAEGRNAEEVAVITGYSGQVELLKDTVCLGCPQAVLL